MVLSGDNYPIDINISKNSISLIRLFISTRFEGQIQAKHQKTPEKLILISKHGLGGDKTNIYQTNFYQA